MELGFTFANYEDSPKVILVEKILQSSGHILLKRFDQNDININYINQ